MVIDHRDTQAMLEQVFAQNELLLEILAPTVKDTAWLKAEMDKMNQKLGFSESIVQVHEADLNDHERRITTLEAAA